MSALHAPQAALHGGEDELYRVGPHTLKTGAYNRPISEAHVETLMRSYQDRPRAMPAIECNMREDGSMVVINGQHRAEAARRLGWETIEAVVHFGWTEEEEARSFRDTARAKRVSTLDLWHASVLAGEADVLVINDLLAGLGLFVPRTFSSAKGPHAVMCPGALLGIAYNALRGGSHAPDDFHPERVEQTLRFIMSTWPEDTKRFDNRIIRTTAAWLKKYEGHPAFSTQEATRKLGAYDCMDLGNRVARRIHADSVDAVVAGCRVFTDLYDKGRRTRRLVALDEGGQA